MISVRRTADRKGGRLIRRQPAKLIIGREIANNPKVRLPSTPGLDVGAIENVHRMLWWHSATRASPSSFL